MSSGDVSDVVLSIKARLQSQQDGIWEGRGGDEGRSFTSIRAELDALWAAVEVIAQTIDGVEPVVVRDYFGESARRRRSGG